MRGVSISLFLTIAAIVFYCPTVNAEFTYIDDDIHPEIGWVDVKQVGWDIDRPSNSLILTVQYQESLPPCSGCLCEYDFDGRFYLDTDQSLTTGYPSDIGEALDGVPVGTDFYIRTYKRSASEEEEEGYGFAHLYRFDDAEGTFVSVADIAGPTISGEHDAITQTINLSDLNTPAAIDIVYKATGQYHDYFNIPTRLSIYNTGSEDRLITVDGATADWEEDPADITDLPEDMTPAWMDAATFYITDSSTTDLLYLRLDLSSAPLSLHPEEASYLRQSANVYIDMDENPTTGYDLYGIGADYQIVTSILTDHASQTMRSMFLIWNPTTAHLERDGAISDTIEAATGASLEIGVPISAMGVVEPDANIPIAIWEFSSKTTDRVPNSGSFTVTTGAFKLRIVVIFLTAVIVSILLVFVVFKRRSKKSVG
jgi:hypothetical protein